MSEQINCTASNVQHLLLQSALAVVEGKLTAKEANAIAGLTAEIHKSIKLELVGKLMNDNLRIEQAVEVIKHVK